VEIPNALYLECPECSEETLHEVLKGRGSERAGGVRLSALVKCQECGTIRTVEIHEQAERAVEAVLSDGDRSTRCAVPLDPSSVVSVGDVLMLGEAGAGGAEEDGAGVKGERPKREKGADDERVSTPEEGLPCLVTAIEVKTRRVPRAKASAVDTLWLKRYDRVKVKVSVNTGRKTVSRDFWAAPDERFEIGDVISAGDMKVLVHSLNTGGRRLRRGSAVASEIRRLYGREVE
jgi:uncharacterized Zn finger protein